ncbi:MAG: putative alpha/beta-hydrolase family hydrolase [Limisphaerales bacterium]|jgi:predicted alpha/beta-hydrolase family hydrolase
MKIPCPEAEIDLSARLDSPLQATHLLVLAHGAGAGLEHKNMMAISEAMNAVGIATLRYNFPYWELGKRRPDRPSVATKAVQAAVRFAVEVSNGVPVLAGGKSFGGRMTSTAASADTLPGIDGLVFFGWPLHAPGKPGIDRAAHLQNVQCPMLFLQGERDKLAECELIRKVTDGLDHSSLELFEWADHSFQVPKKSGLTSDQIMVLLGKTVRNWIDRGMRSV